MYFSIANFIAKIPCIPHKLTQRIGMIESKYPLLNRLLQLPSHDVLRCSLDSFPPEEKILQALFRHGQAMESELDAISSILTEAYENFGKLSRAAQIKQRKKEAFEVFAVLVSPDEEDEAGEEEISDEQLEQEFFDDPSSLDEIVEQECEQVSSELARFNTAFFKLTTEGQFSKKPSDPAIIEQMLHCYKDIIIVPFQRLDGSIGFTAEFEISLPPELGDIDCLVPHGYEIDHRIPRFQKK